jgi:imidazolonepropionase
MPKVLIHASEILTAKGIRKKDGRHPKEEDLGRIEDGALVYDADKILWVGKTGELPSEYQAVETIDLKNQQAIIPGLVDCHTHMVFAGDRSDEFALRCEGASYEEIASKGGGILSTVRATREASLEELEVLAIHRLEEAMSFGVRTFEIKSGYGLTTEAEVKSLEVIQRLKERFPRVKIQATFLGAHAFPSEVSRQDYLKEILEVMLPEVAGRKLADACDVFIDRGYYSLEEGKTILEKAKNLGLKIKLHGDELANTESAALAVELGALSVDHLLKISDQGIEALSNSDTVGVLLPGTAFYLKENHAPARKLIDSGAAVAISTDYNPGSSMCNNLPAIMTISALYLGMTRAEILAAVTYNAAKALGFHHETGSLEYGKRADFTILPFKKFEEMYYQFAWNSCPKP